jgi:YD repeat-containing protein
LRSRLRNNANKQLISQFDYTCDADGQITTWKKNYAGLAAPQRFDLGYDNADQLTAAPLKNASTNALINQFTYGYDPASNRTSETEGERRGQSLGLSRFDKVACRGAI